MNGRAEREKYIENIIKKNSFYDYPYIKEYHKQLKIEGKTSATIYEMLYKVVNYLKFCNSEINKSTLYDYLLSTRTKIKNGEEVPTSSSYQREVFFILKRFFDYLYNNKEIEENCFVGLKPPRYTDLQRIQAERKNLTKDDLKSMIKILDKDLRVLYEEKPKYYFTLRLKTMLLFLINTGMRAEALCEIKIEDIECADDSIFIKVIDKRNKTHKYKLNSNSIIALDKLMTYKKEYLNIKNGYLFCSKKGTRLQVKELSKQLKRLGEKAGIEGITAHKIRAAFCTILYEETKDLLFVQKAVGHNSLRTTMRYIASDKKEKEKASEIMNF